jgi:ABC-type Fe3+/spermidine/putrescine transport system ATPase subunit
VNELAIETIGLGKQFRFTWALRNCSIQLPVGRVSGLVGANGAGKTTLMRLLAGMSRPTAGRALVLGRPPADDRGFLAEVGYLAQEVPLYPRWNAADHLALGAHLNRVWDETLTRDRLRSLNIPLDRPIAALSGGMRAQVALALTLGKRPRLLLLDEPVVAHAQRLVRQPFRGHPIRYAEPGSSRLRLVCRRLGHRCRVPVATGCAGVGDDGRGLRGRPPRRGDLSPPALQPVRHRVVFSGS